MTENLPDYTTLKVPDDKPPEELTHHERRADLLRRCVDAGSPLAVNQSALADEYQVSRTTVWRDMKRLRESVDDSLGADAKLTARTVFESVLDDLHDADDWRASKAAFDVMMNWQDWLADLGKQHREPDRAEVDVRSRNVDVSYQIVREGEDDPLPTESETDRVDHEALGFTAGPTTIEVEEGGSGHE